VRLDGESIPLSTADFDLSVGAGLPRRPDPGAGGAVSQPAGRDYDGQDRSMDVAISRLRRRLGDDSNNPTRIKTVRQKGYTYSYPRPGNELVSHACTQKPGNDSNNSTWIKTVRQKVATCWCQAWE
jgi:hypothetical protein